MHPFAYSRPSTLDEALAALAASDDPKLIAGGMTLLPTMKQGLAAPSDLIDLGGITELRGISRQGRGIVIGAMTCHADVAASDIVRSDIPALSVLAGGIGDPAVRHRGTIGGSLANADPAADYPAGLLGLNGTVVTTRREIAADDFFVDLFETALEPDEIITAIRLPVPEQAGYLKFRHPVSGYAVVGVMVARTEGGVRVAVTGAGPCAFRVAGMEAALNGHFSPGAIAPVTIPPDSLNGDVHCSAEYRAHLVGVMARRVVAQMEETHAA